PSTTTNTLEPVPSDRWPRVSANTASVPPARRAAASATTFSAYDVVLSPASAPRSLRGQGTTATEVEPGGGTAGAIATTSVGSWSARSEPSGASPPVYVMPSPCRPSRACAPTAPQGERNSAAPRAARPSPAAHP